MYSHPNQQSVIDDIGEKFLGAFVDAVVGAKTDLAAFNESFPEWFIHFSKRFVANFIHERMWDRMIREVADYPGVQVVDREPTRQVIVGRYVIRFKRHRPGLRLSTYPTSGALAFWTNEAMIPGAETHSLALGYVWDIDAAEIRETILSYRSELDQPIWSVTLDRNSGEGTDSTPIGWKPLAPNLPELDLGNVVDDEGDDHGSEGQR